jgi:hypothetical protein
MTREYTYSIGSGAIERLTQSETQRWIEFGINKIAEVTDVSFRRVSTGGNFRFWFQPESQQPNGALGYDHGGGSISIATVTQRDRWRMDLPYRYTLPSVAAHEIVCHGTYPFNWRHDETEPNSLFSVNGIGEIMTARDVSILQARLGVPKTVFYPFDRQVQGQKHAELQAERERLIQERDDFIASVPSLSVDIWPLARVQKEVRYRQGLVLQNLPKLQASHAKWWKLNNAWKQSGVKMAHVV